MGVGAGIARGFSAFTKRVCNTNSPKLADKIVSAGFLAFVIAVPLIWVVAAIGAMRESGPPVQLSPAERLALAKKACGEGNKCLDAAEAGFQISKIPTSAPEYIEASKLYLSLAEQPEQTGGSHKTERPNLDPAEAQRVSFEQKQANFQGTAHDHFLCTTSTDQSPIVSFDNGSFWWLDDGRCAQVEKERQEQQQRFKEQEEKQKQVGQKRRDEDAKLNSYWSTTVRVDTDMDSTWLSDEERTCETSPNSEGRVAIVTCSLNSKTSHNIPVVFWGGVDRNTISDWKCRREKDAFKDQFVCRAIN